MVRFKTMDGNEAVSKVAYYFSEICGVYPITPASPMAEHIDLYASRGEVNCFGKGVEVIEMQSEAGAVAVVHGALQSGVLASTFTASQGLLLMIPTLYKMAGEMLPGVIHVASRSLSTHALSIFGDHQDVYAVRGTGVCMLASSSVVDAYYMAAVAHLAAISCRLPFVHFFDGFRTSHEIQKVPLMDLARVGKLVDKRALGEFRNRAMNPHVATTRGTCENDDVYFQHAESRNGCYEEAVDKVSLIMDKMNELNGTDYKPFNYYGDKRALSVIVAMGSVTDTVREVVEYLNGCGYHYGVVVVHLFRPFSAKCLLDVLPKSVKKVAVLDRAKEAGSEGEALYLEVVAALQGHDIEVLGGRYGLSSKNTDPAMIKAVFDNLDLKRSKKRFTVGIVDDVTNLSLKIDTKFVLPKKGQEILIYGYGSDGMVSTSKDLIKVIGDNTRKYVQGYFQYDSKKSGGVTRCHIRISDDVICSPYYVMRPDVVVVSKDNYIYQYDILDKLSFGGVFLLNSNLSDEELVMSLPNKVKYLLASKKIKFYVVNASGIAAERGLPNKISTCMEVCLFDILNILSRKRVSDIMKRTNKMRFSSKGQDVVRANDEIVDQAIVEMREILVDPKWANLVYFEEGEMSFEETINKLKGDSLPVSAFLDKRDGIFKGGNTYLEKRNIASRVPCWHSDACIQCNRCAFVCPHGVIRPFLLVGQDDEVESVASMWPRGVNFAIGVSYLDCTGCGLCSNVCPGKMGKKALTMEEYDHDKFCEDDFLYLMDHQVNGSYRQKNLNVKSEGLVMPGFEFSGSCAGCGEAAYLKNLTQVFKDRLLIANATGCSSIYGASVPSFPYSVSWANSLFEDNAEFGLGIYLGVELKREKIASYMRDNLNLDKKLFEKWLSNRNDVLVCREVYRELDFEKHKVLKNLSDYIVPVSTWLVGGDGAFYDIGFGGLDHVLSRNDAVNVLVLDTEVYSNTGGQASKASNLGAVAQFASRGKETYKKDLARYAMCYPNVYVACCNIGYDMEQYLRALREADSHDGPSLVIVYAPCIEHGIKKGMEHSLEDSYLATKCGYFPIFRYVPEDGKFYLDSRDVDFSLYEEFLMRENRYINLKRVNEEMAMKVFDRQKRYAMKRYQYYESLEMVEENINT